MRLRWPFAWRSWLDGALHLAQSWKRAVVEMRAEVSRQDAAHERRIMAARRDAMRRRRDHEDHAEINRAVCTPGAMTPKREDYR